MKDENTNYLGFCCFFLFIVCLVLGGSFLLYRSHYHKEDEPPVTKTQEETVSESKKKDKNKDFIYFQNEKVISESLQIKSQYPVINLDSEDAQNVTKSLQQYADEVQKTYISTSLENTCENELDTIYSTHFLDYHVYSYKEYVTLVVQESLYTCEQGVSIIQNLQSYTFNVLTGEQIKITSLLSKYDKTLTEAIQNVKDSLNSLQDESTVQVEETIQNLKENDTYIIYIDQDGNLVMKYIVKTNLVDYNDTIILYDKEKK